MTAPDENLFRPEAEKPEYESLLDHFTHSVTLPAKPEPQEERMESMEEHLKELEEHEKPREAQAIEHPAAPPTAETAQAVEALEATCQALSEEVARLQRRLESIHQEIIARQDELQRSHEQIVRELAQFRPEGLETNHPDRERALVGFWNGLTMLQRLECLALSLPETSALNASLRAARETAALLEPAELLLKWASTYPSACAEKLETLFLDLHDNGTELEQLTVMTLREVRARIEAVLERLALVYLSPAPGTPASSQWETAGEEASPHPRGTVARVLRGGLTLQGRNLIAPAVVLSNGEAQAPVSVAVSPAAAAQIEPIAPTPPTEKPEPFVVSTGRTPSWLTTLQAATLNSSNEEEKRLLEIFEKLAFAADDTALLMPLEAVLPLLSPCRHYYAVPVSEEWRATWEKILPEFTLWLQKERSITPLSPSSNEKIDDARMEVTDTRQTLHEAERDHVSRLERPGAIQGSRVLFRAQVQAYRYERG